MKFLAIILGGMLVASASLSAHAQSVPPVRSVPPPPVPASPMPQAVPPPSIGAVPAPGVAPPVAPSSELISPSERTPGTTESGRPSVDPEPQRPGGR